MTDPFDLTGRRALVTGSSRGIGRALALALARHGAAVCVHYATNRDAAEAVADAIAADGGRAVTAAADLGQPGAAAALVAEATGRLGGAPDILIANASVEIRADTGAIGWDDGRTQFDANLMGTVDLVQAATPAMVAAGWGRVVAVGSVQQVRPHPRALVYAALKSAQLNMVRNLALQLAGTGVTVNNLAPGVILTDRNAVPLSDPAYRDWILNRIPMRFAGVPEDCTGAVLLFCSEAGRYITGADLLVDGGMALG